MDSKPRRSTGKRGSALKMLCPKRRHRSLAQDRLGDHVYREILEGSGRQKRNSLEKLSRSDASIESSWERKRLKACIQKNRQIEEIPNGPFQSEKTPDDADSRNQRLVQKETPEHLVTNCDALIQ